MGERRTEFLPIATILVVGVVLTALLANIVGRSQDDRRAAPVASGVTTANAPTPALPDPERILTHGPTARDVAAQTAPLAILSGNTGATVHATGADATAALAWLTAAGIPARLVDGTKDALNAPFLVWRGGARATAIESLERFVDRGGVLVLDEPATRQLEELAGVSDRVARDRDRLQLLSGGGLPGGELTFARSRTVGFRTRNGTLATFDGGETAAIAVRRIGAGLVVATGVPLRALVRDPLVRASDDAPAGSGSETTDARDQLTALARVLFQVTSPGITLGSAPGGKASALVLVHPVASPDALTAAASMARAESERGIRATYVVRARALRDGDAPAVLDGAGIVALRELAADAEIGSGAIAAEALRAEAPGNGLETHPAYAPGPKRGGATISGDLRVARHLLAQASGAEAPVAFRGARDEPGAPLLPAAALRAAGYTVDATVAAASVQGSLPFRAPTDDLANEYDLLRLPVTVDELDDGRPDLRVREVAAQLARARATGAPVTAVVRPTTGDVDDTALAALLSDAGRDVWVGGVADYAAFWSARYGLTMVAEPTDAGWTVSLEAPGDVPSQTLLLPFRAAAAERIDTGDALELAGDGRRISVPAFSGSITIAIASDVAETATTTNDPAAGAIGRATKRTAAKRAKTKKRS